MSWFVGHSLWSMANAGDAGVGVTIAIPARDAAGTLSRCLTAVRGMHPQPRRVLVLDDHSRDGTGMLAREEGVEVLQVPGDGGLGLARRRWVLRRGRLTWR